MTPPVTIQSAARARRDGFTLVEMIGVLAIVAILVSLLLPKIFLAIDDARVAGAVLSYNGAKSAAMTYFGKYGRFGNLDGSALTTSQTNITLAWDRQVLQRGGYLDHGFETKISTTAALVLTPTVAANVAPTADNSAYDLSGLNHSGNDASGGRWVLEAILNGVVLNDARLLNGKIDGADPNLGENPATPAADVWGRVKYNLATGGVGTVRIYIAHR